MPSPPIGWLANGASIYWKWLKLHIAKLVNGYTMVSSCPWNTNCPVSRRTLCLVTHLNFWDPLYVFWMLFYLQCKLRQKCLEQLIVCCYTDIHFQYFSQQGVFVFCWSLSSCILLKKYSQDIQREPLVDPHLYTSYRQESSWSAVNGFSS